MIFNAFNTSDYNVYNIELANMFGLNCSVYISTIISYYCDNISKCNENGFLKFNRQFIQKKTSIKPAEQKKIDSIFSSSELNVMAIDPNNVEYFKINLDYYMSLFDEKNKVELASISKDIKKRKNKKDIIKDELRLNIRTDNAELRDAYSSWIDSVIDKDGWMSKKAVVSGQDLIDSYSNYNLDIALEVLKLASINGYRDMQWAIEAYNRKISIESKLKQPVKNVNNTTINNKIELSSDVF